MDRVADHLADVLPALLFLCAGVPLAALLDRLGFFDAVATAIEQRFPRIPVAALWWLAAATTVVLNLDTTVVLLTPLYIRLARRSDSDPLALALIPLLLASLASSVLPVSNLTTLIVVERFDLTATDVVGHLAPVSVAASLVGWLAYRRRFPTSLPPMATAAEVDGQALRSGCVVVVFVLVGFVVGPLWAIPAWMVALAADVVLMVLTRWVPWREVPLVTAVGVAALAAFVALVVPADLLADLFGRDAPVAVAGTMTLAAGTANLVNNLPAVLIALEAAPTMTWGMWAWLAGVNTGAVLLPLGALANLLWLRIARAEGVEVGLRRYVHAVVPVAAPAFVAGMAALLATRLVFGSP